MSTEIYRAYLDGLDLTNEQKDQVISSLFVICENIVKHELNDGGW